MNYFSIDEPGVGRFLVAMSLQGVVFIALLFLIELRCIRVLLNLCRRRKKVREEGKIGHLLPYYWFGCYQSQSRVCFCQALMLAEEALQPEDRDVAEERKRVLECQPVVESMVGSPLILQELSKVCGLIVLFGSKIQYFNVCTTRFQFPLIYIFSHLLML